MVGINIGGGFDTLMTNAGAIKLTTNKSVDLNLHGPGFNFGASLDYYVTPATSVGAGFVYRLVCYSEKAANGKSSPIFDGPRGDNFSLSLTIAYHF